MAAGFPTKEQTEIQYTYLEPDILNTLSVLPKAIPLSLNPRRKRAASKQLKASGYVQYETTFLWLAQLLRGAFHYRAVFSRLAVYSDTGAGKCEKFQTPSSVFHFHPDPFLLCSAINATLVRAVS